MRFKEEHCVGHFYETGSHEQAVAGPFPVKRSRGFFTLSLIT